MANLLVVFKPDSNQLIYEKLKSVKGIEVFPGCWVLRDGRTAREITSWLAPLMKSWDGLFVTPIMDGAVWNSGRTNDSEIGAFLSRGAV